MARKKYKIYCDLDGVLCNFDVTAAQKLYCYFNLDDSIISKSDFISFFKDLSSLYGQSNEFNTKLAKHYGINDRGLLMFTKIMPNAVRTVLGDDEEFWATLPWTSGGPALWEYMAVLKELDPIIISAPINAGSERGKIQWVKKHLGKHIKVILTSNKCEYSDENSILIDDFNKYLGPWTSAGGLGILHKEPETTIAHLKTLLG